MLTAIPVSPRRIEAASPAAWRRVLWAAALILPMASASEPEPSDARGGVGGLTILENYNQAIRGLSTIDMLGADLFGDETNLANGATAFVAIDASVPTNSGLPVAVGRKLVLNSLAMDERGGTSAAGIFGQYWQLDVPYIRGVFDARFGWIAENNGPRCSAGQASGFAPPGSYGVGAWSSTYFEPEKFWSGNWINIPGQGEEELLPLAPDRIRPSDGAIYRGRTVSEWRISCHPTVQNGSGEGFVAVLPDGTRYRFDWIVTRSTASLMGYDGTGGGPNSLMIPRSEIFLYATQVTDRFGNTVTYSYTAGQGLTSITSSDGASISLRYDADGKVQYVDAGDRRWEYLYTGNGSSKILTGLVRPDQSRWAYAYDNLYGGVHVDARNLWQSCNPTVGTMRSDVAPSPGETSSITITHPAGATGTFRFRKIIHGTNDTPSSCEHIPIGPGTDLYVRMIGTPMAYQVASLYEKAITGPGLGTQTWTYRYLPSWSWRSACSPPGCPISSQTWVDAADGARHTHVFGNDYRRNSGKLLSINVAKPITASLRTTTNTYQQNGDGQPYPACPSITAEPQPDPFGRGTNERSSSNGWMYCLRPLKTSTITQQGAWFTRTNTSFDLFARPIGVERQSSLGDAKTETVTYHDHLSTWMLGQVASMSVDGLPAAANTFHAMTAALKTQSRFGKLERTLDWYADGTLREVKDGLNQKTTFASYKRGIAQSITYENNDSESVVVDDLGQITSHTNAAGSSTEYRYDAMGRLNRIIHPTGDPVTWNDTIRTFEPVSTAEYGLPAGHWRLTESTGNARSITYYDGRWRPVLSRTYDTAAETTTRRMVLRRYDAENRLTFASYPQRTITSIGSAPFGVSSEYDGLGRLVKTRADSELAVGALETRIDYLDGFLQRTTDPRSHVTTVAFQAFDDPDAAQPRTISGELGVVTTITRDVFGKPESMARSGTWADVPIALTRSYAYDAHQRLCRTVEPESGATVYAYDAANNVDWTASGLPANTACPAIGSSPHAQALDHTYDARNRLVSTRYTRDGSPVAIGRSWTPDGLPATVSADGTTWTYDYNRRRLLTSESLTGAVGSHAIGHGYDANGHEDTLTYPGNVAVAYAPNALGEPSQVGSYATNVRYHPSGAVERFTYGNDILHTSTPTTRGLVDVAKDAGVLEDKYDWDENGNVAGITDQRASPSPSRTRIMGYDARDRLTSVHYAAYNGSVVYEYDVLDNLRRTTTPGRDHTYQYNAATNRLTRTHNPAGVTSMGYGYDSRGNVTSRNQHAFDIDLAGRVNRVRDATTLASLGQYRTDGNGRRVGIDTGTGLRPQVYSLAGQFFYEQAAQGLPIGCAPADDRIFCHGFENAGSSTAAATRYFYLGKRLIAKAVAGGATTYLHTDGIGSVVAESTSSGAADHRVLHEPYGAPANGVITEGPGYAGHVVDGLTGLSYMQARYYDPVAARFLAVDPMAPDAGSFNRYWYANNSPYTFIDPDGRCAGHTDTTSPWCESLAKMLARRNAGGQAQEAGETGSLNALPGVNEDGWISSGAIYPTSDMASEGASLHMDDLSGGKWSRLLLGSDYMTLSIYEFDGYYGYTLVPFQGGVAPAFGAKPSSYHLGRALQAAGFVRPVGAAAHHVVAGSARLAGPAREVLGKFGIGVNEVSNGLYLPIAAHRAMHTNAYYKAVNTALSEATTRQQALQILGAVRKGIANGTFP